MKNIFNPAILRVVLIPLFAVCGALLLAFAPTLHQSFCTGLSGLVL